MASVNTETATLDEPRTRAVR